MFNFHKPKVYRSTTGCCICKAKSSSSRFTDSKKYEEDFIKCFELVEPRKGEICNACVLLVKRFKKLPPGSDRNWKHVVDARAGPGMKSMSKFKSKSKKLKEEQEKRKKKHHHHHHHSHSQQVPSHPSTSNGLATGDHNHNHEDHLHRLDREGSPVGSDGSLDGNDDALMAEVDDAFMMCDEENQSGDSSSRTPSPGASDSEDTVPEERGRRRKTKPVKRPSRAPDHSMEESDFIDTEYFKKVMTCCGPVYRGLMGETMTTMVDVRFYKPCKARLNMLAQRRMEIATCAPPLVSPTGAVPSLPSPDSTGISDSSSDSGYDDSSNPGATLLAAVVPTSPSKAAGAATARATDSAFVDGNKKVCTTDCLVVGQISDDIKITNN